MKPSNEEQDICVECGLCCDHTLFDIAVIQPDEYVGIAFTDKEIQHEGARYFTLPCPFFKGCCSIYGEMRPKRCGEYRCNVLKRHSAGELPTANAKEIIRNIMAQRDEICAEYKEIKGINASFREINSECARLAEENLLEASGMQKLDYKVNLLQMQLVWVFRSKHDFDAHYQMM